MSSPTPGSGNSVEGVEEILRGTALRSQEPSKNSSTTNNAIPSHIEYAVAIEVKAKTEGNGTKGVFLLADVVEGDLLLKVKEPLLNIVSLSLARR